MKESKTDVSNAYNIVAEEYNLKFINELEKKNLDRMLLNWFAAQIQYNQTVLEIGAGPGEISGYLHEQNVTCIGTDISSAMVEIAGRNFPDIKFEVQDFFDFTYPNNLFHAVVGFYAFVNYPLNDLQPIFLEVKRILKDDGLFLFSFHIYEDEEKIYVKKFLDKEGSELTFYCYNVDEVKRIVEDIGYEVKDIIIRYPYDQIEYPSKRAYFIISKPNKE